MKNKIKYHLNPALQKLVEEIIQLPFEYLGFGGYSEVYRFILTKPEIVDGNLLSKGDYVIKIFFRNYRILDSKSISYFKDLSNKKLIPQIYIINFDYIIMDYVDGKVLKDFNDDKKFIIENYQFLIDSIKLELQKWWKKNRYHNDLNPGNIIFKSKGGVIFIDPSNRQSKSLDGKDIDIEQLEKIEKHFQKIINDSKILKFLR